MGQFGIGWPVGQDGILRADWKSAQWRVNNPPAGLTTWFNNLPHRCKLTHYRELKCPCLAFLHDGPALLKQSQQCFSLLFCCARSRLSGKTGGALGSFAIACRHSDEFHQVQCDFIFAPAWAGRTAAPVCLTPEVRGAGRSAPAVGAWAAAPRPSSDAGPTAPR